MDIRFSQSYFPLLPSRFPTLLLENTSSSTSLLRLINFIQFVNTFLTFKRFISEYMQSILQISISVRVFALPTVSIFTHFVDSAHCRPA